MFQIKEIKIIDFGLERYNDNLGASVKVVNFKGKKILRLTYDFSIESTGSSIHFKNDKFKFSRNAIMALDESCYFISNKGEMSLHQYGFASDKNNPFNASYFKQGDYYYLIISYA